MSRNWSIRRGGSLGLGGLALLLALSAVHHRGIRPAPVPAALPVLPAARAPSEAALHEAWGLWLRAQAAANRERYIAEEWDPSTASTVNPEVWRTQIMGQEHRRDLQEARQLAKRAEALARTPDQAFRATQLLVQIAGDLADHQAELHEARRLVALAPSDPSALLWLRHAARANYRISLARREGDPIGAPRHTSPPPPSRGAGPRRRERSRP